MCHSPSGAFWVQTPDRAAWALADAASATDRLAAIPPDSTFCVKRFITDLRMKGDSTALLQFVACCQPGNCGALRYVRPARPSRMSRPAPEHRMVGSGGVGELGECAAAASRRVVVG